MTRTTIASVFWANVLECGQRPALTLSDQHRLNSLTWCQLGSVVNSWVCWLQREQIGPGCRLATWLPNSLDWIAIDLACQSVGVVHVAIDRREPQARMLQLAHRSTTSLVLCENNTNLNDLPRCGFEPRSMAELARHVHPDSPAQMLSTSGTCGYPKLVVLSHRNLLGNALAKLAAAPQLSSDLRLNILPFSHAYARTCELSTWILSRSQLAIAGNWNQWLELADQLRPTLANFVPYLAEQAAQALTDCPAASGRQTLGSRALGGRLRLLQVGGAGLSPELWQQLAELGLPPLQGYGLTEAAPVVCSNRSGQQAPGTVGPAVAGAGLHIDEEGVLWTRGPHVMLGYWNDAVATREVIVDGWLCTGDIAEARNGGLNIVGRKSHQIVLSSGYKVAPEEIEARLSVHRWIEQIVISGMHQSHLSACIWPNWQAIPLEYFDDQVRSADNLKLSAWSQSMAQDAARLLVDLPRHAIPRQFAVLTQALSIEAGSLTIKGTPRRDVQFAVQPPIKETSNWPDCSTI